MQRLKSKIEQKTVENGSAVTTYVPLQIFKGIVGSKNWYPPYSKKRFIKRFEKQIFDLKKSINIVDKKLSKVRFVVISDTHGEHRRIKIMPKGDCLIHCGDICGNYNKKSDVLGQFQDFLDWLEELHADFSEIVFIAGNHDTFLDYEYSRNNEMLKARYESAKNMLEKKIKKLGNLYYLENNCCTVTGNIKIFGTPISQCRVELLHRSYLSSAFERKSAIREAVWKTIPDDDDNNIDILLSHGPPRCDLCPSWGDLTLTKHLLQRKHSIKFHCFGHDHDGIGIAQGSYIGSKMNDTKCNNLLDKKLQSTIFVNGAQIDLLRRFNCGFAWTFDVEVTNTCVLQQQVATSTLLENEV